MFHTRLQIKISKLSFNIYNNHNLTPLNNKKWLINALTKVFTFYSPYCVLPYCYSVKISYSTVSYFVAFFILIDKPEQMYGHFPTKQPINNGKTLQLKQPHNNLRILHGVDLLSMKQNNTKKQSKYSSR